MPIGNRVFLKRKMPDPKIVERLGMLPTANIADTMGRSCALNPRVYLVSQPKREITAGPALTVKARAGDNLLIHKALDIAHEGDVIVVSNEGESSRALMGAIMFNYAKFKKVGALVLDGPIRDVGEAKHMDFPIYATGSTPGGPYKEGPGEVNVPISCGEVSVNPGDVIVMDEDGVIVIPRQDADGVLAVAEPFSRQDADKVLAAATGKAKRDWVDKQLREKGIEVIDECCE
jgi:regulator of RNase E activity RraA